MKASEILFRPSELHNIMSKPRTKTTNADKYAALEKKLAKAKDELSDAKSKDDVSGELITHNEVITALEYNVDLLSKQLKDLEPIKDLPHLSESCKKYLKQKYIEIMYNRRKEVDSKYMRKGRDVEEESITAYSLIKGRPYKNNKERKHNAYFTGEIDLPIYDADGNVSEIADIKSSYDAHTFIDNLDNVKKENVLQGLGYMDLYPGCHTYRIANVLVNNTDEAILQALYYESFKWDDNDTPTWRELEIIKAHIFDFKNFQRFTGMRGCIPSDDASQEMYDSFKEIPMDARLIEHTFERDEIQIQEIKDQIDLCREWMRIMFNLEK